MNILFPPNAWKQSQPEHLYYFHNLKQIMHQSKMNKQYTSSDIKNKTKENGFISMI